MRLLISIMYRITCREIRLGARAAVLLGAMLVAGEALGEGYGLKIYRVDSSLYPFVQVYFRTFDQNKQPLINLNAMNIGLMVKGRAYDPMKRQSGVESILKRQEAIRTVLVLDASKSMAGPPFEAALKAAARFIDSKRPQDEVAVLAIRDTKEGYDRASDFERDPGALGRRLSDVRADGQKTRLYDSIGAAMQLCGMTAQGSVASSLANYIVSCSVVVFSDGGDEGSALSREELNGRITSLAIPVPVYSLAYSKSGSQFFKNLEAISKNSFGIYYLVGETVDRMQQIVEEIQRIVQNDYVVTFRSYVPIDGEEHAFKLGVEYPSGSGKYSYESGRFEALEPPPVAAIQQQIKLLASTITALPDNNPYFATAASAPPAPSGK
ncbi:MAG: vWA domain-containing protein [Gammaproteobacteria bacterium]